MTAPESRQSSADRYRAALAALRELDRLDAAGSFDARRTSAHRELWLDRLEGAAVDYQAGLRETVVSRCPHTGRTVALSIDLEGFDGPWWNSDIPRRPLPTGLPPNVAGLDGSVRLVGAPPLLPYTVKLGPQVPTVVPRMLEPDGMVAVISQISVGPHVCHLTAYYASPDVLDPPTMDDWGTNHYLGVTPDGRPVQIPVGAEERDADLRPWMESGRLQWIAPADHSMTLVSGPDGCPYLDREGRADVVWLVGGHLVDDSPQPEPQGGGS